MRRCVTPNISARITLVPRGGAEAKRVADGFGLALMLMLYSAAGELCSGVIRRGRRRIRRWAASEQRHGLYLGGRRWAPIGLQHFSRIGWVSG